MRILYAIQGTGNGHITCARDIIPRLLENAEVDILISGTQVDIGLDYEIKYRLHGLCFVFGKKGGIDYVETYKRSRLKKLFNEIKQLPVHEYDLVISDFEPVSAWACLLNDIPCVGLSHQVAVINKNAPKPPAKDLIGHAVLKYYAPVNFKYGYHYLPYDKNIFTPLIRSEIRELKITNKGHYTVYLPAFSDKRIIKLLSFFPEVNWQVFSKHSTTSYNYQSISVTPVNNKAFIESIASAEGVLCGAGFQTPAEVLFLRKKLMVIPMKGQYEQQCNAAALKMLGVPVLKNLKIKRCQNVKEWLLSPQHSEMEFPDNAADIVGMILKKHGARQPKDKLPDFSISKYAQFRKYVLKKIFYPTQ